MASALSQFLSPVGSAYAATPAFGQGYTPFGSVAGTAAQQPVDTAPKGLVQQGQSWNPISQSVANQIGSWQQSQAAQRQQQMFGLGQGTQTGTGPMTTMGGDWSGVDQWNAQIQAAANQFGVPANLIKAVMRLESGGANLGANGAGAVGPMQVVASIWGGLGYDLNDPGQNIMAGAAILKQNYDQYAQWAQQNGMDPWKAAVYAYYAGSPYDMEAHDSVAQGGSGMSTGAYGDQIWTSFQQLNNRSGAGSNIVTGGTTFGGGNPAGLVQGGALEGWGEFDAPSGNGLYGYGADYGLSGGTHTGLDILSTPGAGEYAAGSGVVMCAGTGVGSGSDGGGCAAFNYVPNFPGAPQRQGAGRIEILLDSGAVLIYGHSLDSNVQVGQRVNAGDLIGTVGGMNSAHTHLDARVRDTSTSSGWRIVDPRSVLGGMPGFTTSGGVINAPGYGQQPGTGSGPGWWQSFLSHFG